MVKPEQLIIIKVILKSLDRISGILISENKDLYTDIIEPLGYRAREYNDKFKKAKGKIINKFTKEFLAEFCHDSDIDWKKLVEFNSGNFDMIKFNL